MVKRDDGQQVGVEPPNTPAHLLQSRGLALSRAREQYSQNDLGIGFPQFFMVIGVLGNDTSITSDDEPVLAVRKSRRDAIRYIITDAPFGRQGDGNELDPIYPYELTFNELIGRGMLLVGRFEKATEADIQWYFDYCADNHNRYPAGNISFPSAEGPGPDGRQGGYHQGKAVALRDLS